MTVTVFNDRRYAPIGLFDSGMGGLSIFMHLKQTLPNEMYVYYADTLNVPYGPRPSAEIKQLTLNAVDWLVAAGCKLIVMACNSASAHALHLARHKYPYLPIVGLVPALKPAVLSSQSKRVSVLATQATLEGTLLNKVIHEYAVPAGVNVIKWFEPSLVPWVESGMPRDSNTAKQLKQQLHYFAEHQVDHLVLGCTHYPFFRDVASEEIARHNLGMQILDSGAAIADRVRALLSEYNLLYPSLATDTMALIPDAKGLFIDYVQPAYQQTQQLLKSNNPLPWYRLTQQQPVQDYDTHLSFFVTDNQSDLEEVSKKVQRLISK